MKITKPISVFILLCLFALVGQVNGQDCVECRQTYQIPRQSTLIRTWSETEMVPVVRTYETREVFAARQSKPRRAVNWACVASGLQAFAQCNFQKRQASQSRRGGRLLSRLFFWRIK